MKEKVSQKKDHGFYKEMWLLVPKQNGSVRIWLEAGVHGAILLGIDEVLGEIIIFSHYWQSLALAHMTRDLYLFYIVLYRIIGLLLELCLIPN